MLTQRFPLQSVNVRVTRGFSFFGLAYEREKLLSLVAFGPSPNQCVVKSQNMCRITQSKPLAASPVASAKNWLPARLCAQHHGSCRRQRLSQIWSANAAYQQPITQGCQSGRVQAGMAELPRQAITGSTGIVAAPKLQVEVSLQVTYKCTFGQQLAVVGSFQGWQTAAALSMTWQAGDVWSAVLPLPSGCDVEYKYVVIDQQGQVVRWQEGGNNKLSLRESGFLLHVTDSWAHESRQVHEIGVPAPSQLQQQRRAAGNSNVRAAAASGQVLLQNNITAFSPSSSMGRLQQAERTATAPEAQQQQQQEIQEQAATSSSRSNNFVEPDQLSKDVAAILPLLQTELASALEILAATAPDSAGAHDELLAEGQSVLTVLQQQLSQEVPPLPAELLSINFDDDDGEDALELLLQEQFAEVEEAADAAATAELESESALHSTAIAGLTAAAEAAAAASGLRARLSSPATSGGSRSHTRSSSRSLAGSPSSALASATEDQIAAALLSDDCEEACFCLVDAICSCMGSEAGGEACEVVYDEELATTSAAAPDSLDLVAADSSTVATHAAVQQAVPVEVLVAQQAGTVDIPSVVPVVQPAVDVQQQGRFTVKQGREEARAAAFAGVQQALQESAELLERLSDPTHPLLLQADREVANAKRQLGHLLAV